MRAAFCASLLSIVFAPNALAQPQTNPAPDARLTYFLVDASGSMANRLPDGTIPRVQADAVLQRELKKFIEANPGGKASVNFYGANLKTCEAGEVTIGPQLPIPDPLPISPDPKGATNLGAWFEAALKDAGDREARIVIITDGGQSQGCGFDVCTIADERLSSTSHITIERQWASAASSAPPPFPCIDVALKKSPPGTFAESDQAATLANEAAVADNGTGNSGEAEADSAVTLQNSYPWALLAALFATSFVMLGISFADAHRKLDVRFQNLSEDAKTGNYVDFAKLRPKTSRARIAFVAAVVLSLGVLWGPEQYVGFARVGAGNALNTEFGAAVFLAALMTLGVFASSQYWRYSELRRTYRMASNEAERFEKTKADEAEQRRKAKIEEAEQQRKAKAEREADRLAQQYDFYRARFSDRDYGIEKHLSKGLLLTANIELLEQVISSTKFLAAGPPLPRDRISTGEVDRIARFTGLAASNSPQALIGYIPSARLPDPTRKLLRDFFYPEKIQDSEEQNRQLKALRSELNLLVTQHSAGT